ncbi:hypothetical protein Ocin01_09633 [Orchesella cincta]|uniref:Uncharacterized protein n=1 Tax=Orchesella cincta TaxID=48709 RepID=A0A1D2MVL8_ORCCI|nr:hypothetical protein Ocin01_09633 [Orchesella cincta]
MVDQRGRRSGGHGLSCRRLPCEMVRAISKLAAKSIDGTVTIFLRLALSPAIKFWKKLFILLDPTHLSTFSQTQTTSNSPTNFRAREKDLCTRINYTYKWISSESAFSIKCNNAPVEHEREHLQGCIFVSGLASNPEC